MNEILKIMFLIIANYYDLKKVDKKNEKYLLIINYGRYN